MDSLLCFLVFLVVFEWPHWFLEEWGVTQHEHDSGGVGAKGKQLGPGEEIQIFLSVQTLMPNYLQSLKVPVGPLLWLWCTWLTHFWKSCCELLDLLHVSEALGTLIPAQDFLGSRIPHCSGTGCLNFPSWFSLVASSFSPLWFWFFLT